MSLEKKFNIYHIAKGGSIDISTNLLKSLLVDHVFCHRSLTHICSLKIKAKRQKGNSEPRSFKFI